MVKLRTAKWAAAAALSLTVAGLVGTAAAGPAIAADEAPPSASTTGDYTYEVGIYIYKKKDADKPAAWNNSTEQTFCGSKPGTEWFTSLPCSLPDTTCGDGWAFQQDKIRYTDDTPRPDSWPLHVTFPDNVYLHLLYADHHGELSTITDVPPCTTTPVEPDAEVGSDRSYSATCETITTTTTAWTQPYVLVDGAYILGAKQYEDAVVTTMPTTPDALNELGLDEPADCAIVPPPTTPTPTPTPTSTPTPDPTPTATPTRTPTSDVDPSAEAVVLASTDDPDDPDVETKVDAPTSTDITQTRVLANTGFGSELAPLGFVGLAVLVIGTMLIVTDRVRRPRSQSAHGRLG